MQELILATVSELILLKIKDPRLKAVSLTRARLTPDLKKAVVSYSIYDDSLNRDEIQKSMVKASGFFRREIGRRLELKHTPELRFEFDRNLEYAQHINRLLADLDSGQSPDSEPSPEVQDEA